VIDCFLKDCRCVSNILRTFQLIYNYLYSLSSTIILAYQIWTSPYFFLNKTADGYTNIDNKEVNCRKQITRQHSCHKKFGHTRGGVFSCRWPKCGCYILIPCARMQDVPKSFWDAGARPLGWVRGWTRNMPSPTSVTVPNLVLLG